ncbi:MAG: hypothetical protein LBN00_10625 [Oscillospiraceae bacterium]|jgi:hypothetical protein|nr:hypothetical protein [Oscillospiraceae bacterium]
MAKAKGQTDPIKAARTSVKTAGILGLISTGVTVLAVVISLSGAGSFAGLNLSIYSLIDVALMLALSILLLTIKSRIAAVVLFAYFALSKILQFVSAPASITNGLWFAIIFFVGYLQGVFGAFRYHKLRRAALDEQGVKLEVFTEQEKAQESAHSDDPFGK